ncbi:MAG: exodeoxyribonuclease VII small subunit [Planctomycetota bacterium]
MASKKRAEGFEEHLAELEKIVEQLESGGLDLDASLERYQEGVTRLKACYDLLKEAERKVKVLLRDAEGQLKETPFTPEAE